MPEEKKTIREAVAETLSNLGGRTREAVIEHFAAEKAKKQADLLIAGLGKLADLERERNKLNRPDIQAFAADGTETRAEFSKERIEQRKKLDEQIEKLINAITKADDNGDFDALTKVVKS